MTTNCGCPGPFNTIGSAGMCPSCGVEGPEHQRVLQEHLAAGNAQPLIDRARAEGEKGGYQLGRMAGRLEVIEALAEREVERCTFDGPDLELAG